MELPALKQVKGAFNMQSSGVLDCSAFQADKGSKQVIKGNYVCQGSETKPGGAGTKASGSATPTSSGKGAGGHIEVNLSMVMVPVLMGGISLIAGLFQLIL